MAVHDRTADDSAREIVGRLYAVQDIVAAAEAQFAETDDHHNYYDDCFNAVQQAIRILEALSQTDEGWRPIETAPKDGGEIILWNGEEIAAGSYSFAWVTSFERGCGDDGLEMIPPPTHWRPLPPPPVQQ